MQSKILSGKTSLIIILTGCVFSLVFIFYFGLKNPKHGNLTPLIVNNTTYYKQKQARQEPPVRLKIPILNVDAAIEYVGVTSDRTMGVPKGPDEVAWFELGQRPGEVGSAVMAGHSGWKNNMQAVFDNLHKLQAGDKIYVEDSEGITTTFIVSKIKKYDPKSAAIDVFVSNDSRAHLNLITCEGYWDEATRSRSKRLVVFTDKE